MGEARRREQLGLPPRMSQPTIQQFAIDPEKATPKLCACGCKYFVPVVACYTVSALLSPTGKEMIAQQPVLVCRECGEALK